MIILHMCNINDNHMIHVSEISSTTDKIICHFGLFFALLPLKIPKKQNLKNWKKMPGDIIILHMWSINDNHMIYGSWVTECDGQSFLSFSDIFSLLPSNNPKNQNFEKMAWRYHFAHVYNNENHMIYGSWDIESDRTFFVILDHFLPFYPLKNPKNKNFE